MKVIVFEESESNANACIQTVQGVTKIVVLAEVVHIYDDRKEPIMSVDRDYLVKLELT